MVQNIIKSVSRLYFRQLYRYFAVIWNMFLYQHHLQGLSFETRWLHKLQLYRASANHKAQKLFLSFICIHILLFMHKILTEPIKEYDTVKNGDDNPIGTESISLAINIKRIWSLLEIQVLSWYPCLYTHFFTAPLTCLDNQTMLRPNKQI